MEPFELLPYLVEVFERLSLRYLVTGSTATILYGEPRLTNDIDVIVDLRQEHIADFCAAFPAPDFYISETAVREAVQKRHQFNIIQPMAGMKVDVIIPKNSAFDRSRLARGIRLLAAPGCTVNLSSPEDVIVKKLDFYREGGSEKHLRDIAGVVKILGDKLDVPYIVHWATELGLLEIWNAVMLRTNGSEIPTVEE